MAISGVIIGYGIAIPVSYEQKTMADVMARSAAVGRFYLDFTVTDTPTGSPRFLCGDSHFISTNVHGGAPVYPVVVDWGVFERNMESQSASVMLAANAWIVNANGTTRKRVIDWLRILNVRDVAISIYQWNAEIATQEIIWAGYVSEVTTGRSVNGVPVVELVMRGEARDMLLTAASDVINDTAFPQAPKQSLGFMVPLAYGQAFNRLSSGMVRNSVGMVGLPMMGSKGLVIDDEEAGNKITVRFNKHDGTSSGHTFNEGTFDDPAATDHDVWCWDEAMGAYGLIDNFSMTFVHDTSKLDVTIDRAMMTHFCIPLSIRGSETSGGFSDMSKLANANPNDYLESTASDFKWAFETPDVPVRGQVLRVRLMVDWQNAHAENRQIRFGLWDTLKDGGAGYLDGIVTTHARGTGLDRVLSSSTLSYDAWNFRGTSAARPTTQPEFRSGRFITRGDADGEEANLQCKVEVDDLGGLDAGREGVRIHHIMLVVTVWNPDIPKFNEEPWLRRYKRVKSRREQVIAGLKRLEAEARAEWENERSQVELDRASRLRGTDFFFTGGYQKDDGSGTYSGSASSVLFRPCDIAQHLIHKRWGKARNVTTGTLANFDDARDTIMSEMSALTSIGPDEVKRGAALGEMKRQWPMFIVPSRTGPYGCIPDDMNPHSSAYFRSSSNIVKIGKDDIESGSFQYDQVSTDDIVNSVELRYAHGYPAREHARSTTYENKLSQKYFTKKGTDPFDAPFLTHGIYDGAVENGATAYAQWLGRRSAMPLILPRFRTIQKFYDLDLGHIFFLEDNVKDLQPCPKFRGGLVYYYFATTASTTDLSDSTSFSPIATGTATQLHIGLPQQVDHITFSISAAATYVSASNAWKYSSGPSANTAFTDALTTNKDALKSTGIQTVSWVKPAPHLWTKEERSFGAFGMAGPCYWVVMDYSGGSFAGTCNARTSYTPGWDGIPFRTFRASRHAMGEGGYMGCAISAREVY